MVKSTLRIVGLTRRFGGVVAVDNVTLSIPKGEIVDLVGTNGASKTTFVNLVTGFVPKTAGRSTSRETTSRACLQMRSRAVAGAAACRPSPRRDAQRRRPARRHQRPGGHQSLLGHQDCPRHQAELERQREKYQHQVESGR
jgi:ATPase subunit of ABC transporter with duplicated ATPase domains